MFKYVVTRHQQVITVVSGGIFLLFLSMLLSLTSYVEAGTSTQNSTPTSAFNLLKAAKAAKEAGQTETAQYFWLRAKSLNPYLAKPDWLRPNLPTVFPVAVSERQLLLDESSQLSDSIIESKLEKLLKENPMDKEVRQALLRIAKLRGDEAAVQRHQSVLKPLPKPRPAFFFKLALLILAVLAILWCVFAPLPGSKKLAAPEGKTLFKKIFLSMRSFIKKR